MCFPSFPITGILLGSFEILSSDWVHRVFDELREKYLFCLRLMRANEFHRVSPLYFEFGNWKIYGLTAASGGGGGGHFEKDIDTSAILNVLDKDDVRNKGTMATWIFESNVRRRAFEKCLNVVGESRDLCEPIAEECSVGRLLTSKILFRLKKNKFEFIVLSCVNCRSFLREISFCA